MFNRLPWKKNRDVEPARPMNQPMARFFENGFPFDPGFWFEGTNFPTLDVSEGRKKITVKAEIPGMDKDDLEVNVKGNLLTIRGEKSEDREEEHEDFFHRERRYGSFHRAVALPAEVDPDDVSANYKRGVLKVVLKKQKESSPRKIRVRAA
jgi:HSP20 family protein